MTPPTSPIWARCLSSWASAEPAAATKTPTTPSSHDPAEGSEVTRMAIEIQPESAQVPSGREPAAEPKARPWWLRPAAHTALIGAIIGYALGHLLGNAISSGYQQLPLADSNDTPIVLGYLFGVLGWLIGLGVFNDPVRQMRGKPVTGAGEGHVGDDLAKYFRYSLDHKVVGIQYLFAMIGNYLVPLMIGSKRVAFPRIEALSFWLTPCAFIILLSSLLLGGFPTGWTGYAPLSIQAGEGMDGYAVAFGLMGISAILAAFNLVVTIICYRAPGMRWSRLPMFVWAMLTTGFLLVLAAPVLVGGMYMIVTDRTAQTAFFTNQLGGSSYLYEDLFWFFGHPEVYILALPGFGIVSEIIPVFCRKPLFGYKIAAAGMLGVAILSFFVWQHHLFDSGMDPDMRPLFMLTTELISIPTGFIYLVAMGTFWKAKIQLTVPMLFATALFINFLFGGISGVFLSDVPVDTTAHGSFFVLAHFHYTIMGGLIFAFFGAIYYWLPKVMGVTMNERLGKIHFWTMFIFFHSTFMPLFAVGLLGQPRRVFEYARNLETLNDWVSISAFLLGVSMLIFLVNFVMSTLFWRVREVGNPWRSRGLEWQGSSPPPPQNFAHVPVGPWGPYGDGGPQGH